MLRSLIILLLVSPVTSGAAPGPQELIASIQKKVLASFQRPPNCGCRQTIEGLPGGPLSLDAGLVEGKLQYDWPGAKKPGEELVKAAMRSGATSSGAYSLYPQNLFLKRGARFQYKGETQVEGRKTHQFNFVVPAAASALTLSGGGKAYLVGYHGSLWADVQSANLVRLWAEADDIPAELQLKSSEERIDYHQVDLGGQEFTLPLTVERRLGLPEGAARSVSRLEGCHAFSADMVAGLVTDESADEEEEKQPRPSAQQVVVVRTAPSPASKPGASEQAKLEGLTSARPVPNVIVPAGLRLEMALSTPISSARGSKLDDPITAVLTEPLQSEEKIYFPAGAQLTGRISAIERHTWEFFDFWVVGMAFDWIVSGSSRAAFHAQLEDVRLPPEGYNFLPYFHLQATERSSWNGIRLELKPPKSNEGVFWRRDAALVLREGLRTLWITKAAPEAGK